MTTPPTPEAVEAAMAFVADERDYNWRLCWNATRAACILAAEVERLKAELERAEMKIEADWIARDHIIAKGVAMEKELINLRCELGHAQEQIQRIRSLCMGSGVGLREDVLDVVGRKDCP